MKEILPDKDDANKPVEVDISGHLIFDQNGNTIGIATNSGSLDYGGENEDVVLVIKPPENTEDGK